MLLGWQVRRLLSKNPVKVVAVAGSIGKTSTKFAIAKVLQQKLRVRFQEGNYNDPVTVPLIFFGKPIPSLFNPLAWLKVLIDNERTLRKPYSFDVVIIELGTDGPGQIKPYGKYLQVDVGVLTAIAPEHMQFFKTLDAVANEEIELSKFSHQLLVNLDLCPEQYLKQINQYVVGYGLQTAGADYRLVNLQFNAGGYDFSITYQNNALLTAQHESVAESQLYSICAAVAVGHQFGLSADELLKGIEAIKPVNGRMNRLVGINNSVILDDTYNASPQATIAALDTLYRLSAPQKIAILGNMNELGDYSTEAHQSVGQHCDPSQLELVVTIGKDANRVLAPAAAAKGCQAKTFDSPYVAAEFLKTAIKPGAVILAKGSQNGVFAEEIVKGLLANPDDASQLVRQSPDWMKIKEKSFTNVQS